MPLRVAATKACLNLNCATDAFLIEEDPNNSLLVEVTLAHSYKNPSLLDRIVEEAGGDRDAVMRAKLWLRAGEMGQQGGIKSAVDALPEVDLTNELRTYFLQYFDSQENDVDNNNHNNINSLLYKNVNNLEDVIELCLSLLQEFTDKDDTTDGLTESSKLTTSVLWESTIQALR
eukprot:sb/3472046/